MPSPSAVEVCDRKPQPTCALVDESSTRPLPSVGPASLEATPCKHFARRPTRVCSGSRRDGDIRTINSTCPPSGRPHAGGNYGNSVQQLRAFQPSTMTSAAESLQLKPQHLSSTCGIATAISLIPRHHQAYGSNTSGRRA